MKKSNLFLAGFIGLSLILASCESKQDIVRDDLTRAFGMLQKIEKGPHKSMIELAAEQKKLNQLADKMKSDSNGLTNLEFMAILKEVLTKHPEYKDLGNAF